MSRTCVAAALRRLVVHRAREICEYCLIHQDDTFFGCAVDHVIGEKHGGRTEPDHLALSCVICNRRKGSDVGSVVPGTMRVVALFNPRTDAWKRHFRLSADALTVRPRTDSGTVTARLLGFNDFERQVERAILREEGRYPCRAALLEIQRSA